MALINLRKKAINGVVLVSYPNMGSACYFISGDDRAGRLVAPEAFGLVAYATVFIAFAQIFVDQGFSDAIVQLPQLAREHLDTAFWVSILTGGLLTIISFFAASMVARLFREPLLTPVIRWLSPVFFLSALSSVQQAILRRNLAFKSLTLRSLVANLSSGVIAVTWLSRVWGLEFGGKDPYYCTY